MYRDYIEQKKQKWVGQQVSYQGSTYTVVDVDYNGSLIIDKPAQFTSTTAITEFMVGR